jgi:hypothetical protein
MIHWGLDDIRIVGDIVVGSLLAQGVRLVFVKGLFEPTAAWIFRAGCKAADRFANDRLPNLPAALGGEPNTPKP